MGQYAYALAVVGAASIPAALGLPTAVVRFVAVYREAGEWGLARGLLRRSNLLVGALGSILALAVAFAAVVASDPTRVFTFWLAAPLIPLLVWTNLRQKALQGLHHPLAAQLPELFVKHVVFLFLGGALWWAGAGLVRLPQGLMAAWLVASGVTFVVGAGLLRYFSPPPLLKAAPRYDTRQWLGMALPMLAAEGAGVVYTTTDIILLGVFRPAEEVGLYQVAIRTAGLILVFLTASNWVLAPWFARLHASSDRARLQRIVTRATRVTSLLSLAVFGVLVLGGRELLALFFGETFTRAWGVLLVLGGARLVDVAAGPMMILMAMTGGQNALAWIVGIAAFANALGCWLLIPRFGMYGAATSTALVMVTTSLALVIAVRRRTGIRTTVFG